MTEPVYLALFVWAVLYSQNSLKPFRPQTGPPPAAHSHVRPGPRRMHHDPLRRMARHGCGCPGSACHRLPRPHAPDAASYKSPSYASYSSVHRTRSLARLQHSRLPESLEFANGPYSAKAIEHRIVQASHPGTDDPGWLNSTSCGRQK